MAVTNPIAQALFIGDGIVTDFPWGFYFIDQADVAVTLLDTGGGLTTQQLNVDYTVQGTTVDGVYKNGATFVFETPPAAGDIVYIARHTPMTQPSVFNDGEALPAKSIETALDRLTLIIDEIGANFRGRTTAAPADGTYSTSDWFILQPPMPGGPRFLICVEGGTPGTWHECAPISLLPVTPTPGGTVLTGGNTFTYQGIVSVPAGSEQFTVVFPKPAPDNGYFLSITPNWNTTWWVIAQTTTGFTVGFGTPAPDDNSGRFSWEATEVAL